MIILETVTHISVPDQEPLSPQKIFRLWLPDRLAGPPPSKMDQSAGSFSASMIVSRRIWIEVSLGENLWKFFSSRSFRWNVAKFFDLVEFFEGAQRSTYTSIRRVTLGVRFLFLNWLFNRFVFQIFLQEIKLWPMPLRYSDWTFGGQTTPTSFPASPNFRT